MQDGKEQIKVDEMRMAQLRHNACELNRTTGNFYKQVSSRDFEIIRVTKKLLNRVIQIFSDIEADFIKMESEKALRRIKEILDNEKLSDAGCYCEIEEIMIIFNDIGFDFGLRHAPISKP